MARMTGKEALAKMLAAEGVEYIFGNPGTSETPFLDVLQDYPSLRYIQALQEGTAVGMADGYARATGKPAFANIHIAGGLANGISALYNAYRGGTPLVLTAGNSDTRMLLSDPGVVRRPGGNDAAVHQVERGNSPRRQYSHGGAARFQGSHDSARSGPVFPLLPLGYHGRGGGR